jgi:quercetin dioxygenase-like cupin family protein
VSPDEFPSRKPLATPGQVVELQSTTTTRSSNQITVLVKSRNVEIVQLSVPAGATIPTYEAAGEIILHCLRGRIRMCAFGEWRELRTNQLVFLSVNEAFSIEALEDAAVLATIITAKQGENIELIGTPR